MTGDPPDQEDLVRRCAAGDPEAWRIWIRRYAPFLAQVIWERLQRFSLTSDPATVEDLLQDVFLALLRNKASALRGLRTDRPIEPYLVKVVENRCVDYLRRARADDRLQEGRLPGEFSRDLEISKATESLSEIERQERLQQIGACLEKLPSEERLALRLFYWEGIPAEGIGKVQRKTREQVWLLLSEARRKLRGMLNFPHFSA